jgi:hypothetical protein
MITVFSSRAKARIKKIHSLSRAYNRRVRCPHQKRLLTLMRHHIDEIETLFKQKNPHALVETGDLVVLCLEMLLEHGASLDEMTSRCFDRYDKKLGELMSPKGAAGSILKETARKLIQPPAAEFNLP